MILYFLVPKSNSKYEAYFIENDKLKSVEFGDRNYQHYKDQVPLKLGGQKWSHLNHENPTRRKNYKRRHAGITVERNGEKLPAHKIKYSAAWFSWKYLW